MASLQVRKNTVKRFNLEKIKGDFKNQDEFLVNLLSLFDYHKNLKTKKINKKK